MLGSYHTSRLRTPSNSCLLSMADKFYTAFAFIGFVLVLIPLPWHLHAWNAGTCLFMIWTAMGCLIHFVNSIVWADNLELHSALWCDIGAWFNCWSCLFGFSLSGRHSEQAYRWIKCSPPMRISLYQSTTLFNFEGFASLHYQSPSTFYMLSIIR